ncbi:G-protein coupled receptor 126-like isoform X1 [Sinocyclocheilus anshuiensis]|uniref:G-protein coupled receptor 126-like isoform X1 n=1 Tax=Sinocyclocheilus anshuiensis TaxID=1608454 RepID=UPI0007BA4D6A|nr:PREDICTED: G-protein coupled receptor 126-like isoform X1 [Sinocyclocheilus anshuiensis]
MISFISGRWWRWKFPNTLAVFLLLICFSISVAQSCQSSVSCNVVLTDSQGSFTSPCYPNDYPPSQACKWTIQAPTGFIVQITFLDFELEEAHGCIYDRIIISTGTNNAKFCGLTPNGLTLNSSGNVMEVSFNSDFSIQKKGFHISYKQVAVALRNQKVTMPKSSKNVVRVSNSVSIPVLTAFTVCFEIARTAQKSTETIFTLSDASGTSILAFEKTERGMELFISGSYCSVNDLLTSSDITSSMTPICLTWTKSTGLVAVYFGGHYRAKTCAASQVYTLPSGGILQLAGKGSSSVSVDDQNLDGFIYNFRLWDYAMPYSELSALTCDVEGNVIDWDHHYWTIPGSHTQTDSTLSCSTAIATLSPGTTGCTSPGLGCPATLTVTTASIATTNMIPFNAATHALTTTLSYTSASSMPLTTTSALLTPTTSTKTTATTVSTTSSLIQSNPPPINPAAATNSPLPNRKTNEDIFYRISLVVIDEQANTPDRDAKTMISQWLNQTFQNWIYRVYVESVSLQPNTVLSRATTIRQSYMALLVYKNTTDASLAEVEIENILRRAPAIGNGLILDSVTVNLMENCQAEEFPFHYKWPESRPTVTQYVPCFPYKEQNASRTCMISQYNYTSYWALPDRGNCTNITSISVSQENAMEVAVQLADITNNELSKEEVTQVVFKVKELVNIAKINATLASTVVTIISNVMISSEAAQKDASETALKAVDELVQKIEFDGPSLAITSKYLAVGVSALNISNFNGTTFSAFIATNLTDPQIDFESEAQNALAVVTLPPTLLHNLSYSQMERVSRINFMFFSKTGLFQHFGWLMDRQSNGMSLNSYVVASSVGNFTIKNLQDPVKIEIAHLEYQRDPKRLCVFWDFSLQSEDRIGGWNSEGCEVSPESNSNRTICLCNHLTHFGILMDISGASAQIDEKNNRVLTFITYIGCGISAIFSAATLLTYIAFEKLRRDYPSKILMNLSTSLLFLNMVFLLDGWLASYDIEGLCVTVAVFLHFFLLTSFTWMGLESIHMYIALVKVFNTYIRRYILKFCLVGWGVPASIVGIVLAVGKNSYGKNYYGKGENGQGTEFCWIHSPVVFYVTCVGYFSMIFLMNVAMFIVVMIQICGRNGKRSNRTLQEEILRNLRSVVSLTFLLGMTWGFAFFAWGPVSLAFMYLFSIFNSLQGLFIFVFHCALKENVQKQWRRYICCGKFRLADNSDWSKTATNNTKKVSSDNLGKSLSSSSFGSTTANWTSKAKATLNPFARHSNAGKSFSNQSSPKCSPSDGEASSSILPVHQVLDKVKGYCSVRSDNFYKNIIMSDSFSNSTKF